MEEDKELENIRQRKLRQLFKKATADKTKEEPASSKPIEIRDETLEEVIKNHTMVVVDCWAPWCGPCQIVAPVIEEMARDYFGRILFGKLNVDENRRIATQYQIMSIPTLLVFKERRLVDRIVGAMPRQVLEPRLIKHL